MLDVRRLRLLYDLSRLGTIAAVAQAHTYTPSAVSQQLAALEREAGVALLEHTGRRVSLTAAGRVVAQHAEAVLAALEETSAALEAMTTEPAGQLRIGAFPTAVRTLLPATLVSLGRRHPRLELEVTELDPLAVPAALHERRLDIGLLNDYDVVPIEPEPALDTVPLLDETVFLAVPDRTQIIKLIKHSAAEPTDPSDTDPLRAVRDADWILAGPDTLCHTMTLHVCRIAGFTPHARHHADDFATVLALVAADQGVSLVPQLAAAQPPAGVRLIPIATRRRTRIAYRRGTAAHPAITAFVAAIREAAAALSGP
ncbi:MAG TPA: LysR substrate-binding domain-containing protein [Actinocrinis sp.]|jgi:DNA-binding transcriptional LysR family regulator